ncbi:GNAT family N-acetyltransferase [Sphingomonas sp. AP4-R1]|uniref:GNAT family N-acetyltransferase n=1 Tax=Sphingomonas sp. AP4-R1 TaxID=2735134 RepID=UPI0014935840|nr:GNAT family N-acetyltransferase [Sphingomonas sp. AP4-R1]QJU59524.1 GNAT family N-acetyltransferase [Sphingomonas sp. AP4-R1]
MSPSIRLAIFPDDREAVLDIWREFVASPSVSLDFQGNEAEFAALPGKYAPPAGRILLAEQAGAILGCVALRKVDPAICEMKRLYVRPAGRGIGLGRRLVERLIAEARDAGYAEMRLDVLAEFERARALYRALGFGPADPVTVNPLPGTSFLGRYLI